MKVNKKTQNYAELLFAQIVGLPIIVSYINRQGNIIIIAQSLNSEDEYIFEYDEEREKFVDITVT